FFQAEDGIRDRNVTGVQTCALPISPVVSRTRPWIVPRASCADALETNRLINRKARTPRPVRTPMSIFLESAALSAALCTVTVTRSEERRVGKECRSRAAAEHEEKNT